MRGIPRRVGLALFSILLCALALSAQQQSPAEVTRNLESAERLRKQQKADEAMAAFKAVIEAAPSVGLDREAMQAQCGLGEMLIERTAYAESTRILQECLGTAERLQDESGMGRALWGLSRNAELMGKSDEAVSFGERCVAAYDAAQNPRGRARAGLQLLRVKKFPSEQAQAMYERVIRDARLAGDRDIEAGALHDWGDALFTMSRFEEALDTLTRARDLYHTIAEFKEEGTVYNSIGRIYRAHGRLDEALKSQLQALALHEKYGGPFELMQSHNAVAVVENMMGHLTAARTHYERALAIARQSSSPRIQDFLNANIALLLIAQGEDEKAVRILEETLSHGADAFPNVRYANLSFAYLRLNRTADAIAAADRALATCGDDQIGCVIALTNRAQARAVANEHAAAHADLQQALQTIERVRTKLLPADFLKQNFHEMLQDVYSSSIAVAFHEHEDREALETAELASSRAFLDLLAARGGSTGAEAIDNSLASSTGTPARATDIAAIAARLDSTAVIYWPADDALFVWVVTPEGHITARRVGVGKARLVELISATSPANQFTDAQSPRVVRSVATRGAGRYDVASSAGKQSWRRLYDVLIAPIRDQLPRRTGSLLTIIPHGVLMNVSFAALPNHNGRYLLEDYAIHYAPAGAVLQFTSTMRRPNARNGAALLVADPAAVRQSPLHPPLPPLPGARREVASIAGLIPRNRITLLEGRAATQPRVTAAAAEKTIVHFATHAIVRDDEPNGSYLAFAPGTSAPTGLLTAREVYDLDLNADLVVLSACQSGGGRITGDGVATFARAFMYAGTPSVVVSLWDVADEPTSRLLPAFYRSWLNGASKARSLRRAQLKLLADLRAGTISVETRVGTVVLPEDPIFWSGFVLIGEPE